MKINNNIDIKKGIIPTLLLSILLLTGCTSKIAMNLKSSEPSKVSNILKKFVKPIQRLTKQQSQQTEKHYNHYVWLKKLSVYVRSPIARCIIKCIYCNCITGSQSSVPNPNNLFMDASNCTINESSYNAKLTDVRYGREPVKMYKYYHWVGM